MKERQRRARQAACRSIALAIGFVVLGALAGVAILVLTLPVRNRWHRLTMAPQGTVELYLDDEMVLCARTDSAERVPIEPIDPPGAVSSVTKPCEQGQSEFSPLTNAPKRVVDCVGYEWVYMDSGGSAVYALDDQGQVWVWERSMSAYQVGLELLLSTACGGVVGLVVGVAWAFRRRT